MKNIQDSVDGSFGRPHIANYLIQKGIVKDKQEAFDKYLVKCDVPKYPLSLAEASMLVRNAGGTSDYYVEFASRHKLVMTGGSDCHQKPIIMGTVEVPDWVAKQFSQER